ncbi:hypothetical protein [Ralstonia sp. 24A2]|uniref:hypothetical protein n=1 Tax=Ralstonia sp. 24A2 TaxID=3447364 RepID=UPI003F6971F0
MHSAPESIFTGHCGRLLLVSLTCALTACSPYVLPTIDAYCQDGTQGKAQHADSKACKELPTIAKSVSDLQISSDLVRGKIEDRVRASQAIDLATFAFATGFAAKALHGSSLGTNGAKNLALGAGASYTAGTLFFPRTTESLYLSADAALVCVGNRGNGMLAAYDQAATQQSTVDASVKGSLVACQVKFQDERDAMAQARAKARATIDKARSSDGALGVRLSTAGANVLVTLNQQLLAQSPSPEAILNAGKSATAIAIGLIPTGSELPAATGGASGAGVGALTTRKRHRKPEEDLNCAQPDQQRFVAATEAYAAISTALEQQLNAIGDLETGCVATAAVSPQPLSVSQQQVTLVPGGYVNVTVSGGRPPMRAYWVGTGPDEARVGYTWLVADRLLHLNEPHDTGAKSAAPYKLRIVDSAVAQSSVEISVTTTGSAPE